ncbi:BTAD domain-containing putative transcriptional regulator [Jatrophihabitans fulvus]
MAGLLLRVLGPVEAERDGEPVDLGGARQRSVVARLLVAGGQIVPAEVLVGQLWRSDLQPRALASLQAHVSHLRRALEPDRPPRAPATVLVSSPPGYALRAHTDAAEFARLVAAGDAEGDPAVAAAHFAEALRQWRGPAYAEFADAAWAEPEVARLTELRSATVEREAAARMDAGDTDAAVASLQAHLSGLPLREEAWRLLALALYRAGRQADALAALRDARRRLADELGVDPGPALRTLESDVLAHAPHLMPSARTPAAPPAAAVRPASPVRHRLVGRDDERELVATAAARARAAGRRQIALVAGDAGEGKTALLDTVTSELADDGWTVVGVRCPETDGAPSGWPWVAALRALADRIGPSDDALLAGWLTDSASVDAGDMASARFRVHGAAVRWLSDVAARTPLLVAVDDLHRADGETASLLLDLVEGLAGSPVLVVLGHRRESSAELTRVLGALARHEPVRVELGGLSPAAVAQLVAEVANTDVAPAEAAVVAERSGGNPFFVRELTRLLDAGAEATAVPDGVRDVVRHRLALLPARVDTVLHAAAAAGREVDLDVLLATVGGDGDADDLLDAVEAAVVSGLLVERGPDRVAFTHALVRDTLYDDLSAMRAARWHGRLAAALERLRPDAVTALAHHHGLAGSAHAAAASRYAVRAAELATSRFAHTEAAQWWQRAVAAHGIAAPDAIDERVRLHVGWIAAVQRMGDVPRARTMRADVLPTAAGLGDPELVADVVLACEAPSGWSARDQETPDEEFVAVVAATADALSGRPERRARLLAVLAQELEASADRRGYEASREALALARDTGEPGATAHALNARYLHTYRDGAEGLAEREAIGRELLELAVAHGYGHYEAAAHFVLLQVACAAPDLDEADRHAAALVSAADRFDAPLLGSIAAFYDAVRLVIVGDDTAAEAAYDEAAGRVGATGWWTELAQALRWLGVTGMKLASGTATDLSGPTGALFGMLPPAARAMTAEMYACTLLADDRGDEARRVLDDLDAAHGGPLPVRPNYLAPLIYGLRAEAGLGLGDRARIDDAYEHLLPFSGTVCGAWTASVCLGPTDTLLARLADARGDSAAAAVHAARAVEVARRVGNVRWAELAQRLR